MPEMHFTPYELTSILALASAWATFATSDYVYSTPWADKHNAISEHAQSMAGILLPLFADADKEFAFLTETTARALAIGYAIGARLDYNPEKTAKALFDLTNEAVLHTIKTRGPGTAKTILAVLAHWFPDILKVAVKDPGIRAWVTHEGHIIDETAASLRD